MELHWGIFATGRIAEKFARDLLVDPSTRRITDIRHVLSGVASSTSLNAAKTLIHDIGAPEECQSYEKYSDLIKNPEIDIVYIASPHSHHFQNAMLALEAGKHVLCEKPLTMNSDQAKKLFSVAEKRSLFLMEGMWTRFQPVGVQLRRLIENRVMGNIVRIMTDNSLGVNASTEWPPGDRMTRRELGGGALMDMAAYPIHWILQALEPMQRRPLDVVSCISRHIPTGVDESVSIVMRFASSKASDSDILAIASVSLPASDNYDGTTPIVRIQGDKGEVQIFGPSWRPSEVCVVQREQVFGAKGTLVESFENYIPENVHGLCFEADEAARCIRKGQLESPQMPWAQSLVAMEILDKVRKDNGILFPSEIDSLDYPNCPS